MLFIIFYLFSLVWFSYRNPAAGIVLAANSFLFAALHSYLSGGASLVSLASPIMAFLIILIRSLYLRRSIYLRFSTPEIFLLLLLATQVCTVFYSPDIYVTLEYVSRLFFLGFSFYFITKVAYGLYRDKKSFFEDVLCSVEWIGFFLALIALWYGKSSSDYIVRLTIGNASSIPLAISLGLSLLVSLYSSLKSKVPSVFLLHILVFVVVGYALIATNTRSVVIGFVLALLFLLSFNRGELVRANHYKVALVLISGVSSVLYVVLSNPELVYRLSVGFSVLSSGQFEESESSRVEAWQRAWEYFSDNPIWGIGSGIFEHKNGMYPHNIFMEVMSESGMLGLVFLYAWLVSIVMHAWGNRESLFAPILMSITVYLFFVAQVSLSFWMHKMLFVSLAIAVLMNEKTSYPRTATQQ